MKTKDALVMVNSELKTKQSERLEQIFETVKTPVMGALTVMPICYGLYYLNNTIGIIVTLIGLAFFIFNIGRTLDDLKSKEINENIRELKQLQYQLKMGVNVFEHITPENFKENLLNSNKKKKN